MAKNFSCSQVPYLFWELINEGWGFAPELCAILQPAIHVLRKTVTKNAGMGKLETGTEGRILVRCL